MTDREIFRDNLNYYLNQSGRLQRELAEYVGAKYTTVSGWTRGISYPRADAMEKIANFFGIPTTQLIGERSSPTVLSTEENSLIMTYRHLNPKGKELLHNRADELLILYGKKDGIVPKQTDSSELAL